MPDPNQDIGNARLPAQAQNMQALAEAGKCLFCPGGLPFAKQQPVFQGMYWYVKPNDFPYKGAQVHVMAVPHRHVTMPNELSIDELEELYKVVIPWLQQSHGLQGCSGLFRFGDTRYTGATIHHFHMHFIQGDQKADGETEPLFALVGYKKP